MASKNLTGFGEEFAELNFNTTLDWFIHYNDIFTLWKSQPTYLIVQASYLIGGLTTFIHALHNGNRLPFLWLATICHGVFVEWITYILEDIDNFWHSQTPIIFLGCRLPLHIILLYPVFIYNASVAVAKAKLPSWAEPFAVGLLVVLIDIPYDIVSVKFVHWTWHDTDPNIYDRHYWVPWNSYYFHATFAASFTFWFHRLHSWITNAEKWKRDSVWKEVICSVLTGVLGMPGGVLLFIPLYHPLHDIFGLHSEVTFFFLFTVFLLIIWHGDRSVVRQPSKGKNNGSDWKMILVAHLLLHYLVFLSFVIFGHPEQEVSTGLHEKTGPCNETMPINTAFGMVLEKRRYLCVTDYDEDYFTFECLKNELPKDGMSWYTICGTPFRNRVEYIVIIVNICIVAFVIFFNLHFRFNTTLQTNISSPKKKLKNQ